MSCIWKQIDSVVRFSVYLIRNGYGLRRNGIDVKPNYQICSFSL